MNWLAPSVAATSLPTTSCGAGRSPTSRASGLDLGLLRASASSPTSACSARARCRARSGSPARVSTTPSTCLAVDDDRTASPSSAARRRAARRAHVRRAARPVARARAGLQRLGVRPGRPRRRLPAEHPGDAHRVHRDGQPRRDLGDAARPSSAPAAWSIAVRADRAEGAARSRRLRLPRPRVDRRAEVATIRARLPTLRARRARSLRRARAAPTRSAGRSCSPSRAARVRAGCVRPPALRPLLLRHDRAAEGDRPRPRRACCSSTTRTRG